MDPDSPGLLLAAAHAENGEFDLAVKYQQQAVGDKKYVERENGCPLQRLEGYKKRQPYRTEEYFLPTD